MILPSAARRAAVGCSAPWCAGRGGGAGEALGRGAPRAPFLGKNELCSNLLPDGGTASKHSALALPSSGLTKPGLVKPSLSQYLALSIGSLAPSRLLAPL